MSRRFWTEGEASDALALDYDAFAVKYPDRARSAWQKKRELIRKGEAPAPMEQYNADHWTVPPSQPQSPPPTPTIVGVSAGEPVDIEAIRRRAEDQFRAVNTLAERKRQQHLYFPQANICLVVASDQHFGAKGTDIKRAYDEQAAIMATPNTYVMLGGDLCDNMIVGRLMAQQMFTSTTQEEAWAITCDYIKRFEGRLVGGIGGNHTQWITNMVGLDFDKRTMPDGALYDSDEILATVHVGASDILIRLRHKFLGSSLYNPTHGLERAARFDSSRPDVYIGCHVHKGAMAREFVLDGRRKLALLAGTYKQVDGFQRQEGFPQNDASTAVALVINADGSYFGTGNLYAALNYMKATSRQAA